MNQIKMNRLNKVVIRGFKSIKACEIELRSINVFIGSNGSGKSNFISLFELLQKILQRELALYTGKKGITSLLYNGKAVTDSIFAEFCYGDGRYSFELEWTENDSLFFRKESYYHFGLKTTILLESCGTKTS